MVSQTPTLRCHAPRLTRVGIYRYSRRVLMTIAAAVAVADARSEVPPPDHWTDNIRPERYASLLCGEHLPPSQRPILEAMYAPRSDQPVTPHRQWGTPLHGGPLRVLFVVNLAFQREVVELAQRFEMNYDFVPLLLVQRYKPAMMTDIARNRYDVIVTSALSPDDQMAPFTGWLREQVAGGTGWIAVNSGGACATMQLPFAGIERETPVVDRWRKATRHPIIDGVPIDCFPPFESREYRPGKTDATLLLVGDNGGTKLMVNTHENGRIVNLCSGFGNSAFSIVPRPLGSEHVNHHFPYWEYEYSLLAKAMMWAAHRELPVRVTPTTVLKFRRGADQPTIELSLSADTDTDATVEIGLWNTDGQRELSETRQVFITTGAAINVKSVLPAGLAAGPHLLDAVVRDPDGRVLAWESFGCDIEGDVRIAAVDLDKEFYSRGDTIHVSTRFEHTGPPRQGHLRYELRDTWKRTIFRSDFEVTIDGTDFVAKAQIPIAANKFLTDVYRLAVMFEDGVGTAAFETRRVYIPIPPHQKHETWWSGGTAGGTHMHPHIYEHMAKVLRSFGLNAIMSTGTYQNHQAELVVENNLWITPGNIIQIGHWNKRFPDGIRSPCLSDPRVLNEQVAAPAYEFARQFRKFGALGLASMEEVSLCTPRPNGTVCQGPHCRTRFVHWLRNLYADLNAVNDQWGTNFTTWNDVGPLRWEDGAGDLANPSRWIDFRLFMEQVYAGMQRRFNESIRKADPGAYPGYNCGPYGINPFGGFNRALLGRDATFSIEYQPRRLEDRGMSTTMELLADTAPQMKIGFYLGYDYLDLEPDRYWFKVWWMAFRQLYGPFYYTINNDASTYAGYSYQKLHPTLADNGFTALARSLTHDLTRGVGKIFLTSTRHRDIAVYFSEASMMRNYYEKNRFRHSVSSSEWDVRKFICEDGLDYRRLVARQLLRGKATRNRVLIMPDTVSLSDREWQALEYYLESGGTVIGFARVGITDGYGKVRTDQKQLKDIFGINFRGEEASWKPKILTGVEQSALEGISAAVTACNPFDIVEAQVLARFADGAPAIVQRPGGMGSAIYCNFNARMELTADNRRLISALLESAGVERRYQITAGDERANGFQTFRYTCGPIEYFGLHRTLSSDLETGAPLQLRTGRPAHAYDVLAREYRGRVDTVPFAAPAPGRPLLFACLPYRVESVTITSGDTAQRGQLLPFTVEVHGSGDTVGDHVLRIEVVDADSRGVEPLCRNVLALSGRYEGRLPFAYNDPAGQWKIRARDVVSGKESEHELIIF